MKIITTDDVRRGDIWLGPDVTVDWPGHEAGELIAKSKAVEASKGEQVRRMVKPFGYFDFQPEFHAAGVAVKVAPERAKELMADGHVFPMEKPSGESPAGALYFDQAFRFLVLEDPELIGLWAAAKAHASRWGESFHFPVKASGVLRLVDTIPPVLEKFGPRPTVEAPEGAEDFDPWYAEPKKDRGLQFHLNRVAMTRAVDFFEHLRDGVWKSEGRVRGDTRRKHVPIDWAEATESKFLVDIGKNTLLRSRSRSDIEFQDLRVTFGRVASSSNRAGRPSRVPEMRETLLVMIAAGTLPVRRLLESKKGAHRDVLRKLGKDEKGGYSYQTFVSEVANPLLAEIEAEQKRQEDSEK